MKIQQNKHRFQRLTAAALLLVLLAGCSEEQSAPSGSSGPAASSADNAADNRTFNETGLPLVNETTTLTIAGGQNAQIKKTWNDMIVFKKLEELTNVHVEWDLTPNPDWSNKRNLLFAGGDLPDAILNLSNGDLVKYGAQGTLIPLEGLIEQYAPNLTKVLEEQPKFRKAITAPDGHIYAFPRILDSGIEGLSDTHWINKTWLDKLSLPLPTTTEEYRDVLKAFKENDLNGNGKKDEIPFSFVFGGQSTSLYSLFGAFGVLDNPNHINVNGGQVEFSAIQPEYKEAIHYFHSLYADGLIDPESFTQNNQQYTAKGTNADALIGSYVNYNDYGVVGEGRDDDYVSLPPLKGPGGAQQLNSYPEYYLFKGALGITNVNPHSELTVRWIDQVFDTKTSWEFGFGPFGVNYTEKSDGTIEANPVPEGLNFNQFRLSEAPANDFPYIILRDYYDKVQQSEAVENRKKLVAELSPYQVKEYYPDILFSEEDQRNLDRLNKDIVEYVNQQQAKWIVDGKIDEEWDAYVAQINKMGLDELISIYQTNLDRDR